MDIERNPRAARRRRAGALAVIAGCAALFASCAAQGEIPVASARTSTLSTDLASAPVVLGPGDLVRVGVFGHPELSTPFHGDQPGTRIDPEGQLSLPLAGAVPLQGLTVTAAREAVTAAFARYVKEPRVDLSVVEWSARRFYLYGEVVAPGAYVIDRPLDLLQALTYGKGFTPAARREEVVLLRGRPGSLEVHVFDGETPTEAALVALQPDDFLFVRRSGAGRFSHEALPILQGIGSALASAATILLIEDQLSE
jgi:protein involved in polysaccharide export with SLBB domain